MSIDSAPASGLWLSARESVRAALGLPGPRAARRSRVLAAAAALSGPVIVAVAATHELLYNRSPGWIWLLVGVIVVALVARRRMPMTVFLVCLGAVLVLVGLGVDSVGAFGVLLALYSVAAHRRIGLALIAAGLLEVGVILASLRFAPSGSIDDAVVLLTGLGLGALFLGTTFRANRRYAAEMEDRAARLEREKEQARELALSSERTRIAREMHDIVAHGLAVVVTLSEGAAASAERDPIAAKAAMGEAAAAGRRALVETRRVLRVLRTDDGSGRDPAPSLSDLGTVVDPVRRAGRRVDLHLDPGWAGIDPTMQTAIFRIVQEALTNILKHAPSAASVAVSVLREPGRVRVKVHDDGSGPSLEGTPLGGSGLIGMRERADLFGGRLDAGPDARGWTVSADLPEG